MKQQQASHVLMEVSSHALSQYRVHDVCFDVAVFTNLTQDHLDYHGDMQHYAQEKQKLFAFPSLSAQVINADDNEGRHLLTVAEEYKQQQIISYSCAKQRPDISENVSLIYASNIQFTELGIAFDLSLHLAKNRVNATEREQQVKGVLVPLMGLFNLSNVLASVGVLVAFNYSLAEIVLRLKAIKPIAGRMQKVPAGKNDKATIIIDYAHTPDALEKSLQALVAHCTGKLWCVFGCGGNRDKGKRKLMAQVASKYADEVVITSDNPRDENPMDIIADIKTGMSGHYSVQENREKAIYYAVGKAAKNDVVLVAGKGHEDYQEIKQLRYPFSDLCISKQALAS